MAATSQLWLNLKKLHEPKQAATLRVGLLNWYIIGRSR